MLIGEFIHKRRIALGLTLDDIGEAVGVGKSTVKKWETGYISNMKRDKIDSLAKILNVSPSVFINSEVDYDAAVKSFPIPTETAPIQITGFIPVFGEIPAGAPAFEEEYIIDYVSTSYPHPENYFALKVKGTSMINAGIPDGAYVTIKKQNTAEDGQIVACRLNGEEATLKRFRIKDDTIILMPENPEFSPIIVSAKEFSDGRAQILGVAKEITIKI